MTTETKNIYKIDAEGMRMGKVATEAASPTTSLSSAAWVTQVVFITSVSKSI